MTECTPHATLAAGYQLVQSVLKIPKSGIGGGGWVSPQGAVHTAAALASCKRKPWPALAGPFLFPF